MLMKNETTGGRPMTAKKWEANFPNALLTVLAAPTDRAKGRLSYRS